MIHNVGPRVRIVKSGSLGQATEGRSPGPCKRLLQGYGEILAPQRPAREGRGPSPGGSRGWSIPRQDNTEGAGSSRRLRRLHPFVHHHQSSNLHPAKSADRGPPASLGLEHLFCTGRASPGAGAAVACVAADPDFPGSVGRTLLQTLTAAPGNATI